MKNFIVIIAAFFACFTAYGQDAQFRKYQSEVQAIKRWGGESRRDFLERCEREEKVLRHKYLHHSEDGTPKACNNCEICRKEFKNLKEETERRESKAAKIDSIRMAAVISIAEKADSLRKVFIDSSVVFLSIRYQEKYYQEKTDEYVENVEKIEKEEAKLKAERIKDLNLLEKQYTGRLVGEVFAEKKAELDVFYSLKFAKLSKAKLVQREAVDVVMAENESFKKQLIVKFNNFLLENNCPARFLELEDINLEFNFFTTDRKLPSIYYNVSLNI